MKGVPHELCDECGECYPYGDVTDCTKRIYRLCWACKEKEIENIIRENRNEETK